LKRRQETIELSEIGVRSKGGVLSEGREVHDVSRKHPGFVNGGLCNSTWISGKIEKRRRGVWEKEIGTKDPGKLAGKEVKSTGERGIVARGG